MHYVFILTCFGREGLSSCPVNYCTCYTKILVTGGTGFIGAYIIKELVEKGYAVRAIRHSKEPAIFYSGAHQRKS